MQLLIIHGQNDFSYIATMVDSSMPLSLQLH